MDTTATAQNFVRVIDDPSVDQAIPWPNQKMFVSSDPAPGSLARKMVAAMGDIEAVTKSGKNEKQNYKYVKAADVANEVRGVLVKYGIAFFFSVVEVERWDIATNSGGKLFFCQLLVDATFEDMDTGDSRVVSGIGWGQDTLEKAPYKALTGALKYVLRTTFLIPDEEDPENEKPDPRPANPPANRPQVSQTPAKGTDAPRPSDRKPVAASEPSPAPSAPATEPAASTSRARTKEDKTAHNARIRVLQEAVAAGTDPETHASKVKEYIIAEVGPDYVKAPFEKWENVLLRMEAAKVAGSLNVLIGVTK